MGASENPSTSQTFTLGDGEDKLDALENPENPFTGSNFTWGEREENFGSANSFNKQPNKMIHHAPEDPIDIQIFMDSNRKFISEKRVSPDGRLKAKISPCGSISDLGKLVNSIPENLKALLIHTGVNDIELEPDVNQIHSKLYDNIMKIRDSHPNLKIILSEITPRFDSLDKDVLRLNAKIFNSFKAWENIFVVHHNNLRKEEFYYDNKHLKKD